MSRELTTNVASLEVGDPSDCASRNGAHDEFHRLILCGAIAVVVLALVMDVRDGRRVSLGFLPGWPLPELCQSKALFGWECPGCGLTRSFIYLAHGEFTASIRVHRVGWVLALAVVLQIPYRLWALRSKSGLPLGKRGPNVAAFCVIALLVANWLAGLLVRWA